MAQKDTPGLKKKKRSKAYSYCVVKEFAKSFKIKAISQYSKNEIKFLSVIHCAKCQARQYFYYLRDTLVFKQILK